MRIWSIVLTAMCLHIAVAVPVLTGGSLTAAGQPTVPVKAVVAMPFGDRVFDIPKLLAPPLDAKVLKSTTVDGITTEEVMFHSEMDGDKRVDIFAIFSYPAGGKRLPALIWNQGGLYQASDYWTKFAAKRGYAALCIDFPLPGYRSTGSYNITSNIEPFDDPKQASIYHGAVALLRAVSYLESRDEVDKDRIGMCGSSWGGFYTTFMVGLDKRLKAGSAMFGSGALQLGCAWFGGPIKDKAWFDKWSTTLDPAWRLPQSTTPMNWCATTNDNFYWMPALMESHARAGGPKNLALIPNWDHALTPQLDDQVFAYLDHYLQGKPALNTVSPVSVAVIGGKPTAIWTVDGPREIASAELFVSPGGEGNWRCRVWTRLPATVQGKVCYAVLPASGIPMYISGNVTDKDGYRASTPLQQVQPNVKGALPDTDGCVEWGDFEKAQTDGYLALHGYPCPPLSPDAKSGAQAGIISGSFTLPPARFIAGVSQTVSAFVKADKPVEMTLTFTEKADGIDNKSAQTFAVGTDWAEIRLPIQPISGMDVSSTLVITAPKDAKVLLDAVKLTPNPTE